MKQGFQKKCICILLVLAFGILTLTACSSSPQETGSQATDPSETEEVEVRQVTIGVVPAFKPITYADDDGRATGYDVEVFRKIDEMLPEYEFTYEMADKETVNIGIETGRYIAGLNGFYRTAEREEKFLFTDNVLGYNRISLIVKEDNDDIHGFADIAGQEIAPITSSSGMFALLRGWNDANPGQEVLFTSQSANPRAEKLGSVRSGQYIACLEMTDIFLQIEDESIVGGLKAIIPPVGVLPTYPLINKDEVEFCEKVNEALAELRENGTLSEISMEFYNDDVFTYPPTDFMEG